jgi:aldehyde:ferredoxin oxidoreductase
MAEFGYAGEILKVDLSNQSTSKLATADYAERFLGGKGIAAKIYWDIVPPWAKAFDSENCLICASGPIAGFTRFASSRWLTCGRTAAGEREAFSYGNLGGSWGNRLKYAGYDGIAVQGKADKPVYIFVHDGTVEIRDASHLWGKTAFEALDSLKAELGKAVSVLTIGQAAENLVVFATLFADEGASGSGGTGSIMGSKKLKAIVVAGDRKPIAADPERLRELGDHMLKLARGAHPVSKVWWIIPGRTKSQACHRCGLGCTRQSYIEEGKRFKCFCQAIDTYRLPAMDYYNSWNEVILLAMRLCDQYGLDSSVMEPMIEWLAQCYQEGVLHDEDVGLPLSKIGGPEFIESLTRKIAMREGFGDLLAQGTLEAARSVGGQAIGFAGNSVMKSSNEKRDYDPRLFPHNALIVATEPRRPIQQLHEGAIPALEWLRWVEGAEGAYLTTEAVRQIAERYWGSAAAADYSNYEGKALASKRIQDRTYALENLILCNHRWPMIPYPVEDEFGGPALASQIYSAVTGRELDERGLEKAGEIVFNLQRAVLIRQGWGGREGDKLLDSFHEVPIQEAFLNPDCIVPGKNGKKVSRKGAIVERDKFEKLKSEYYELRGWDVESGFQTKTKLEELGLGDIAEGLEKRELLKY